MEIIRQADYYGLPTPPRDPAPPAERFAEILKASPGWQGPLKVAVDALGNDDEGLTPTNKLAPMPGAAGLTRTELPSTPLAPAQKVPGATAGPGRTELPSAPKPPPAPAAPPPLGAPAPAPGRAELPAMGLDTPSANKVGPAPGAPDPGRTELPSTTMGMPGAPKSGL